MFNIVSYDFAWADRTPSELTSVGSDRAVGPGSFKELNPRTFSLPQSLGTIKDTWSPSVGAPRLARGEYELQPPVVIHIQDAHCNYYAQNKIAEICQYLNKEYGVNTINLEGGAEDYDLSIFTDIADKSVRKRVADSFVKDGVVNGAEYFALNNPGKVTLWGIEDPKLYIENLKVYRESLKYKDDRQRLLKNLSYILTNLRMKLYSKELLELDVKYSQYKSGGIDLKIYLNYLIANAKARLIDIKSFRNVFLLNQTLKTEGDIDFNKANNQRDALIDKLQKKMSRNMLKELVSKTVEFKAEKISQEEFYIYLIKTAKSMGISIEGYPELEKYIVYISSYAGIDKAKIIDEISALETKMRETLYRNDMERELDKLSKDLVLTKNIFNISISRDDYKYYKANEEAFDTRNYVKFIEREASLCGITAKLDDGIARLDQYRNQISKFYEYSFKRDEVFIKNLVTTNPSSVIARAAKRGEAISLLKIASSPSAPRNDGRVGTIPIFRNQSPNVAILITGGFHTENLAELFRENNIAYISIMPNFTIRDGYECPYFKILSGEQNIWIRQALPGVLNSALAPLEQLSPKQAEELVEGGVMPRVAIDPAVRPVVPAIVVSEPAVVAPAPDSAPSAAAVAPALRSPIEHKNSGVVGKAVSQKPQEGLISDESGTIAVRPYLALSDNARLAPPPSGKVLSTEVEELLRLLSDDRAKKALIRLSEDPSFANVYIAAVHLLKNRVLNVEKVLNRIFNSHGNPQEEYMGELVSACAMERAVKYSRITVMSEEHFGSEIDFVLDVDKTKYAEGAAAHYELEDGAYIVESKTENADTNIDVIMDQLLSHNMSADVTLGRLAAKSRRTKLENYTLNTMRMRNAGGRYVAGIIFVIGGDAVSSGGIEKFTLSELEQGEALEKHGITLFEVYVPDSVITRTDARGGLSAKESKFVDDVIDSLGDKIDTARRSECHDILAGAVARNGVSRTQFEITRLLKEAGAKTFSRAGQTSAQWESVFRGLAAGNPIAVKSTGGSGVSLNAVKQQPQLEGGTLGVDNVLALVTAETPNDDIVIRLEQEISRDPRAEGDIGASLANAANAGRLPADKCRNVALRLGGSVLTDYEKALRETKVEIASTRDSTDLHPKQTIGVELKDETLFAPVQSKPVALNAGEGAHIERVGVNAGSQVFVSESPATVGSVITATSVPSNSSTTEFAGRILNNQLHQDLADLQGYGINLSDVLNLTPEMVDGFARSVADAQFAERKSSIEELVNKIKDAINRVLGSAHEFATTVTVYDEGDGQPHSVYVITGDREDVLSVGDTGVFTSTISAQVATAPAVVEISRSAPAGVAQTSEIDERREAVVKASEKVMEPGSIVKVLIGVLPTEKMSAAKVQTAISGIDDALLKNGYGDRNDNQMIGRFVIALNEDGSVNREKTRDNMVKALEAEYRMRAKDGASRHFVVYVPQMAGADGLINDTALTGICDPETTTLVPDAYSDCAISADGKGKNTFPDIMARVILARLIVQAAKAEKENNLQMRNAILGAAKTLLQNISLNKVDSVETVEQLMVVLRLTGLRVKPVNYSDIDNWKNSQILTASSA
ncbi:MAG: hypothetical protein PHS46_04005 [Candidatus Omnitrophica bacterium]|nr:hypothetical protein [Candidatus Omnitrophota bacterium]